MKAGFNGAFGAAEGGCGFRYREVLEEVQSQDFAVAEVEFVEGFVDGIGVGGVEIVLGGTVDFEGQLVGFAGHFVADAVGGEAVGDAVEPGTECGGIFEFADAAEGAEPEFLDDVDGGFVVAEELCRIVAEGAFEFGYEVGEGFGFTVVAAEGEPFVADSGSGIHFAAALSPLMSRQHGNWFTRSWFTRVGSHRARFQFNGVT